MTASLYCQDRVVVHFHIDKKHIKQKLNSSKDSVPSAKSKVFSQLKMEGYVGLSIKDSSLEKATWHYYLTYDKQFKSVELRSKNDSQKSTLSSTLSDINLFLENLENNGYPFAKITVESLEETDKSLIVNYQIDSGHFYTISKIHFKSNDPFNEATLSNIIDLSKGEIYDESKIRNLGNIINNSELYTLLRSPEILFKEKDAELYIYFKKKKSSNADGFIGFQQNAASQKLELNGNINLRLKNALNRAELLNFNWKSNPDKSQNLFIDFKYPYLINLPFGVSSNMTIQKQDTTFLRNTFYGSLQYLTPYYSTGAFIQFDNSFLLGDATLPNFTAFSKNIYGLESSFKSYNSKRYQANLNFKIGLFNFSSDSLESETSTSNLLLEAALQQDYQIFKPFYFRSTLAIKQVNTSYRVSDNELFYFGGLKSVRGFYELELNGNTVFYALNAIEFKPVSALSFQLIYDYSQFHSNGFNRTHSLGLGFNLNNDNNALSFVIANGVLNDNPIDLRNTKLHIGLISNF